MAKLNSNHKRFIVKQLACFNSATDVAEMVKTELGIEVTTSQVSYYNPEGYASWDLSDKWKRLFELARRQYIEESLIHPIAHKGYRLGELQRNYNKAKKAGNIVLCNQILEQAAKETGGIFEGKGNDDGGGGNTINNYIKEIYNRIENKTK